MSRRVAALRVDVTGRVQGVGFRPFVAGLAASLGVAGTVQNRAGAVRVEIEGEPDRLARFVAALSAEAPPLARIDRLERRARPPRGLEGFRILASEDDGARPVLTPDAATCAACLRELWDPSDRRHRYPFLNCTDCGPRLTLVTGAPYDRARTTMAGFAMCPACRREYEDPADRRHHAQPIACPDCGPRLDGSVEAAARALARGAVVALQGLGGFHLACDARSSAAVRTVRARKRRPDEPLALMVADLAAARALAEVGSREAEALRSPAAPVVLCRRRAAAPLAPEVAPGLDEVGLMLPYTPLHHLLMDAFDGPVVLTSANVHGEPMIHTPDREALGRLADHVLAHDRPIANRCDDSVVRVVGGALQPIRLARGYAPLELRLPAALAMPTLALGGHLKATFAFGEGERAVIGPHVGDLDALAAEEGYERVLERLAALHRFEPRRLVLDAHPDYATRRIARRFPLPALEVQHHHAHFAACLAEHGVEGEAIGVVYDGAGDGRDGTLWGGELLVGGIASVARAGHLRPVGLPGGERAIREPWRMALAHLLDAGIEPAPWLAGVDPARVRAVRSILPRAPRTSSVGRLFDAVAHLAGVADAPTYEAQGPMRLEALARDAPGADAPYPFALRDDGVMDPRPLFPALLADRAAGAPPGRVARRFHDALVDVTARAVLALSERRGIRRVALSGGAMLNVELSEGLRRRLSDAGLVVYVHRRVPPNDGGLCLGQLAIAAARPRRTT